MIILEKPACKQLAEKWMLLESTLSSQKDFRKYYITVYGIEFVRINEGNKIY